MADYSNNLLELNVYEDSISWRVNGLDMYWNQNNYEAAAVIDRDIGAQVSNTIFPNGAYLRDVIYPPVSGARKNTDWRSLSATPGNTYTFYLYVCTKGGVYYRKGNLTVTTPLPTPSTPSLSLRSKDGKTIKFRVSTGSNTQVVNIDYSWVSGTVNESISIGSNTYTDITVTVPNYNTSYTIRAYAVYGGTSTSPWSSPLSFTSDPPPSPPGSVGEISIVSLEKTSIGISWNSATGATIYRVQWKQTTSSTYYSQDVSSTSFTIGGLAEGTEYNIRVYARKKLSDGTYLDGAVSTTIVKTIGGRPLNWEWDNAKVSGNGFNLTATEWNNFIVRINEFRSYKGKDLYSFNIAAKGNDFTATMFNQACNAISEMNPAHNAPAPKNKGDYILASYFTRLRDSLNSIT